MAEIGQLCVKENGQSVDDVKSANAPTKNA
jgi:hypothetical protein